MNMRERDTEQRPRRSGSRRPAPQLRPDGRARVQPPSALRGRQRRSAAALWRRLRRFGGEALPLLVLQRRRRRGARPSAGLGKQPRGATGQLDIGDKPTFLLSLHTTYSFPRRRTMRQASHIRLMDAFTFMAAQSVSGNSDRRDNVRGIKIMQQAAPAFLRQCLTHIGRAPQPSFY